MADQWRSDCPYHASHDHGILVCRKIYARWCLFADRWISVIQNDFVPHERAVWVSSKCKNDNNSDLHKSMLFINLMQYFSLNKITCAGRGFDPGEVYVVSHFYFLSHKVTILEAVKLNNGHKWLLLFRRCTRQLHIVLPNY